MEQKHDTRLMKIKGVSECPDSGHLNRLPTQKFLWKKHPIPELPTSQNKMDFPGAYME